MKLLENYMELQEKIYRYFGYVENWNVIPIDDNRCYYWHLTGENHGDSVKYAQSKENVFEGTMKDGFEDPIYMGRFLKKAVYRGKEYTMIVVDTECDGNKFLSIFDNSKEIK